MSTGGYGDQADDPDPDSPQNQGLRPRVDTEYPGPEPVVEGREKNGSPVPEGRMAGNYGTTSKQGRSGGKGSSAAEDSLGCKGT